MSEPDNRALRLLKKLRDGMREGFARVDALEQKVDQRFDDLEKRLDSFKQAAFGESVLGRCAVADMETGLLKLEEIMALRRS
jgi:hypothetical protein